MSDRIAVMSTGRVVQIGTPIEVYEQPRTRFVSEFLGTANILPGEVAGPAADGHVPVRLDGSQTVVSIAAAEAAREGARIKVALRPERMRIGPRGEGIPARLRATVFRGSYYAYELDVEGSDKPVYVYADEPIETPEDGVVGLSFNPRYSIVLQAEAA